MIERKQYQTASLLVRLGNAVTYYRTLKLESMGLTSVQGDAIRTILQNPGITASQLKHLLDLSQSTVAGILARLVSKGLITKTVDDTDTRKTILMPTRKGLDLAESLQQTALETQRTLTAGLSPEEQQDLDRLLRVAFNNMKEKSKDNNT